MGDLRFFMGVFNLITILVFLQDYCYSLTALHFAQAYWKVLFIAKLTFPRYHIRPGALKTCIDLLKPVLCTTPSSLG